MKLVIILSIAIAICLAIICVETTPTFTNETLGNRSDNNYELDERVTIINMTCYDECMEDCFNKYRCGPINYLRNCAEICVAICSNERDIPPWLLEAEND